MRKRKGGILKEIILTKRIRGWKENLPRGTTPERKRREREREKEKENLMFSPIFQFANQTAGGETKAKAKSWKKRHNYMIL